MKPLANRRSLRPLTGPPEIEDFREIENDSKLRASFVVVVPGVAEISAVAIQGQRGLFVKPQATRDATGAYRETTTFDRGFAVDLCKVIESRLEERRLEKETTAERRAQRASTLESPRPAARKSAVARGTRRARSSRAVASDRAQAFLAAQESAFDRAATEFDELPEECE